MPGQPRRWEILCLALLALACQPPAAPRSLLLVVIDTLRADHLGVYGYSRATSPHIDAFAADATRFANAVSPSPWTLPALGTLMTSLYPSVHGARLPSPVNDFEWLLRPDSFRPVDALDGSRTTLAEILQEAGFATAAWVRGSYASAAFGIDQGFAHFVDNGLPGFRFNVDDALAWLDRERPERFFVYLHAMEVHSPYVPADASRLFISDVPESRREEFSQALAEEGARYRQWDFDPAYAGSVDGSWEELQELKKSGRLLPEGDLRHLIALYDRGIAYTDDAVGHLLDGLSRRGLLEETMIVLASDHGDEFFEHGGIEHTRTYYEEMLHVPFIVRVPSEGRGRVVEDQVGLIDVLPTVLDVLGVEAPGFHQGRSLRPLLRGDPLSPRTQFAEASRIPGLDGLRTDRWKYVRHVRGHEELYDLARDPGEQRNLCPAEADRCAAFRSQLQGWRREVDGTAEALSLPAPRRAKVDARTREQLRRLGYAGE